ncbi:MAG TPA: dTDP-4-dehydrorhamnose 3,5-epimerase [Bryobacteraceae bacterium]
MTFREITLPGVWEINIEPERDERGFFARSWCRNEFESRGLNPAVAQCSISFNPRKGTLRGLHYQEAPHGETKLVRCTQGAIYDVVVDLRPHSPTFAKWTAVTLTSTNHRMVYVPEGCGHGFLTLEDETEVFYQISEFFHPGSARGVRWNDPRFQIGWPVRPEVISERDRTYDDFQ